MKNDTTPTPSLKKEGNDVLINPDFKIQDADMIAGNFFKKGTQTYELKYFNSEIVKLYDAAEDWEMEERRNYFQKYYTPIGAINK